MDVLSMQDKVRWEDLSPDLSDPRWAGQEVSEEMMDRIAKSRWQETTVTEVIAESLARIVLPLKLARYVEAVNTPQQLDAIAELARMEGVYKQVAGDIAAADRRIMARIKAGVVMAKGRAKLDVWNPSYYRRMYERGFREVNENE